MSSRKQTLLKTALIFALNICIFALALFPASANTTPLPGEITPTVSQYGSKGAEVTKIQQRLKNWGYFDGPVTGNYGSLTTEAVKKFQKVHGLPVTGNADAATLEKIGLPSGTASSSNNSSDYHLLARIISAEARGEPYVGQVAVGAVVLNRVEHPSFPDSVSGVVYQPGAFTAITDKSMKQSPNPPTAPQKKRSTAATQPAEPSIITIHPKPPTSGFAADLSSHRSVSTCSAADGTDFFYSLRNQSVRNFAVCHSPDSPASAEQHRFRSVISSEGTTPLSDFSAGD